MSIGKVLVTAAALTLGSMGAAMASEALVNIDGLNSVGDEALSEKHGKDINVNIADGKQKLEQTLTGNSIFIIGDQNSGTASVNGGTNNAGLGNYLANSGNFNNLGQQIGVVLILH